MKNVVSFGDASEKYRLMWSLSIIRCQITSVNPFRYRGYYYDTETGFYYLQSRYYNPQWGRFLNADGYVNANGDIIGFNMFAYCSNNPILFTDPSGEGFGDWLKEKANDVGEWFSNTFGTALYVSNTYEGFEVSTIYYGYESGASTSAVIAGDNSKPVTFYAQNASEWWKFWEYSIGVNVNIGNGGFNIGFNSTEISTSVCINNNSVEFDGGVMKAGITVSHDVNFKDHTASTYTHVYVRPWTIAVTVAAVYLTAGAAAPAIAVPLMA